jgi:F-type H+-transporting ATPase subunit epsilon
MAEKLSFDLVSPERLLLSDDVDMVVVPSKEGDMGIMSGHAPIMTVLRPGVIDVEEGGQSKERYFVRGGFAEVTAEGLTLLAEHAVPLTDLSAEHLDGEIKNAEEDVEDAQTDEKRQMAQERLDHLRELRKSL